MKYLCIALVALCIAGCATKPENIKPLEVAVSRSYCDSTSLLLDSQELIDLSRQQTKTAKNDAWGVAILGVPTGSLTGGDHKDRIAELKGKVVACMYKDQ